MSHTISPATTRNLEPAPNRAGLKFRAAAVSLLTVLVLTGATAESPQGIEASRRRIANMSQSELNRLKRNFARYEKMSSEEKAALRQLRDEIDQDARRGGHLQKLIVDYNEWLSNLSPFDRDQLLGIDDVQQRVRQVQKLRDEQKQQHLARTNLEAVPLPVGNWTSSLQRDGLSPESFQALVTVIEEKVLPNDLRKINLPATLTGRARHLRVFKLLMDSIKQKRENGVRSPDESLVATMIAAIPNPGTRTWLEGMRVPRRRTGALGHLMARSLMVEWGPEIQASTPSKEQTDQLIEKWIARVPAQRRNQIRDNLKTPEGQRLVQLGAQQNPQLRQVANLVLWLMHGFADGRPPRPPARTGASTGRIDEGARSHVTSRRIDARFTVVRRAAC